MSKKRTIIIGDVHGCLDELENLLDTISYSKSKDRLVFVGDLLDRGPYSAQTIEYVMSLDAESVCGNHENKILRYHKHQKKQKYCNNHDTGPYLSEDKKHVYAQLSDDELKWLEKLPKKIYIKHLNLLVVHAGVLPHINPLSQTDDVYMYCRFINPITNSLVKLPKDFKQPQGSSFWADCYKSYINIIYGHEARIDPLIQISDINTHIFGIDTGCVFGNKLTATVFENQKITDYQLVFAPAKKTYYQSRHF